MAAAAHQVGRFGQPLRLAVIALLLVGAGFWLAPRLFGAEGPSQWSREFPRTDFGVHAIPFDEIDSDGATRDSIPPIHDPRFVAVADADIGPLEPVLSIGIEGDFRAYPLRILLWHEIVNDVIGGVPVLVSYCPLCNSGVVYDRRMNGEVLQFGNTGRLRRFDMVMYDVATESWWQQFTGQALIGELTGKQLKALPARLESFESFAARAPDGKLLMPSVADARPYGTTPYVGMDSNAGSLLARLRFRYDLPDDVPALSRVVIVGDEAWSLDLVAARTPLRSGDLTLSWEAGQNSIHDSRVIAEGQDVGNVIVQRATAQGTEDVPYDVSFAFAFAAFVPDGILHHE